MPSDALYSQADVQDPENESNMTCMSYIEKRISDHQQMINQCISNGERAPEPVKQKFKMFSMNKAKLTNAFNNGQLTEETYVALVKK